MKGKINGAVETCGESFHRYDRYLNFSNPIIAKSFDPHACGWAFGMNVFDLAEWRRQNITQIYHSWQKLVRFSHPCHTGFFMSARFSHFIIHVYEKQINYAAIVSSSVCLC